MDKDNKKEQTLPTDDGCLDWELSGSITNLPIDDYEQIRRRIKMNEKYKNAKAWSRSAIVAIQKGMEYYSWYRVTDLTTAPMLFGLAFEDALMTGKVQGFIDKDQRPEPEKAMHSKLNKEWVAEQTKLNMDKYGYLISKEDASIIDMLVGKMKDELPIPASAKWQQMYKFSIKGHKFKTLPDLVFEDGLIVDIKTVANLDTFKSSYYKYGYELQMIMAYLGYKQTFKKNPKGLEFYIAETNPPHRIQRIVYEYDTHRAKDVMLDVCNMLDEFVPRWKEYKKTGKIYRDVITIKDGWQFTGGVNRFGTIRDV